MGFNLNYCNKIGGMSYSKLTKIICKMGPDIIHELENPKRMKTNGKQGVIYETRFKKGSPYHKIDIIMKYSNTFDNLVVHEYLVMKSLSQLSGITPHFARNFNMINVGIRDTFKKSTDTFNIEDMKPNNVVEKNVLLMEKVECVSKFGDLLHHVDNNVSYSIMLQTLCALKIAQKLKKFTHYDLHSYNILVKGCDPELVFLYVIDGKEYVIPTYGFYPIILDFGYSYTDDLKDNYCWGDLSQTDIGHMSHVFDPMVDFKLFLYTLSYELKSTAGDDRLSRAVKKIFGNLKVEKDSGWDIYPKDDVITRLMKYLKKAEKSSLYYNYKYLFISLLKSLIIIPFKNTGEFDEYLLEKSTNMFITEFIKIESEVSNHFKLLYILKGIIDFARILRPKYEDKNMSLRAIKQFETYLFERINSVTDFCRPKNLNADKMLCGLFMMTRNIEPLLFRYTKERLDHKSQQYEKMPIKTTGEVIEFLQEKLPYSYTFSDKTIVHVQNSDEQSYSRYKLTADVAGKLNKKKKLTKIKSYLRKKF